MPPLVKICGLTLRDQAENCAELGADFIGLNFWPSSKRYLDPAQADWVKALPESLKKVGVFVNATSAQIMETVERLGLNFAQLHGDESPDFCEQLLEAGVPIIKAFQVRDETTMDLIADYPATHTLLDAYHPHERGGIGESFPWDLARRFSSRFPDRQLILAGGLTPENIASAVSGTHPYAVDVASGVESGTPGIKDMQKVSHFISRAKGLDQASTQK
jgi:phosphoribosylanthranilate isomerase